MALIPDLVQDSKLDTEFHSDPEYTQHVQYVSGSTPKQRRLRKEYIWKREKGLGRGGFGIIWLERCIQGDSKGEVRVVKKIQKLESSNYYRELEAIALFSQAKYDHCFVKSFGWYDNIDSVFITMEYLPNGDLHKYLTSPLSEEAGQDIIFQILEGLQFMHNKGFAHRDLKPANILIVHEGPDWWVKIADFGISKRSIEGVTALRTQIGTPAFAAPEVIGFFQPGNESDDSYTTSVDIWSLSVITFFVLTGETLFRNQRRLANEVSGQGCEFVRSLMAPKPKDRPKVKECLQHPWLKHQILESQRPLSIPLDEFDTEPSASWSTHDQSSAHKTYSPTSVRAERATYESSETVALPTLEPANSTSILAETIALPTFKPGQILQGHTGAVMGVAFSPDGKQIASASCDGTFMLWDLATGFIRRIFRGHRSPVYVVAFSPNGKEIVSASQDPRVKCWDSATGSELRELKWYGALIKDIIFSTDGKQIAFVSPNIGYLKEYKITLCDSVTGTVHRTLPDHPINLVTVIFSPNGKQIASVSDDKTVRLWDSATGAALPKLQEHLAWVNPAVFSPNGMQIASVYTLQEHSAWVNFRLFSPDGKRIAFVSGDGAYTFFNKPTGPGGTLLLKDVSLVAISPDWEQIVSPACTEQIVSPASEFPANSYGLTVWHSTTGAVCGTLRGHVGVIRDVKYSPNGKHIATASDDCTVRLWDME